MHVTLHNAAAPPLAPTFERARWLARLWRLSRLTLLLGDAGSGKSQLVRQAVLPLMARRAVDRQLPLRAPAAPGSKPAPAPPVAGATLAPWARRSAELAMVFSDWQAASPSLALRRQLLALLPAGIADSTLPEPSLAQAIAGWQTQCEVRCLIVLDAFEALLAGLDRPALQAFADELVDVANHGALPVHFLLVLRDDAEPLLEPLRQRLPDFGGPGLRLTASKPGPSASAPAKPVVAPEPPAAGQTDVEFSLSLQVLLSRVAALGVAPGAATVDVELPLCSPAPARPALAAAAAAPTSPATNRVRGVEAWALPAGLGLAALMLLAGIGLMVSAGDLGPARATPTSAAVRASPALPADTGKQPRIDIVTAIEDASGARLATELLRAIAPAAPIDLVLRATDRWADGLASLQGRPRLALVSYDVLQAARRLPDAPGLQIVMPMTTSALHFVVPADSPLQFIHQIEGARINIGPASGHRALTARAAYQSLFGKPLPDAQADLAGDEAALARLAAGGRSAGPAAPTAEVLLLVGAQPAEALADLNALQARGLRLLALDRSHPASLRALRSFLPAVLEPRAAGLPAQATHTLSVMNFLVASADAEPELLARLARSVCAALPALQQGGHPTWRQLQPTLDLPTGWPMSAAAAEVFDHCMPAPSLRAGAQAAGR